MLTPQEVSEHAFSKASFGGYQMSQVDDFLDSVTTDYAALYKENAVLKGKMKVLVDKVEEYRATEDAMRQTLLAAQRMATAIVAEAETKRDTAVREAEEIAKARVGQLSREIEAEELRLTAAKNATAAYLAQVKGLMDGQLDFFARLGELAPPPPKAADPVTATASEIESSVHRLLDEPEAPVPPSPDPEDEGDTVDLDAEAIRKADTQRQPPSRSGKFEIIDLDLKRGAASSAIDFDHLQFGKDYEIE